jgi:hypothetical protein
VGEVELAAWGRVSAWCEQAPGLKGGQCPLPPPSLSPNTEIVGLARLHEGLLLGVAMDTTMDWSGYSQVAGAGQGQRLLRNNPTDGADDE